MAVSNEMMKDMYTRMLRIRDFENATSRLYAEGKIPGFCHLYIGEEAVATGVCECLTDEDYITSTHRGHGHIIAKGGDMRVRDGVYKRAVAVVCVGDGVPVTSGDGSRHDLSSRLRMRLYYIKSLMQNLTYS